MSREAGSKSSSSPPAAVPGSEHSSVSGSHRALLWGRVRGDARSHLPQLPAAAILQLPSGCLSSDFPVLCICPEMQRSPEQGTGERLCFQSSASPLGLLAGVERPAGAACEVTQQGAGLGEPLVGAVAEPRCSRAMIGREIIRCGGLGCQGSAPAEIQSITKTARLISSLLSILIYSLLTVSKNSSLLGRFLSVGCEPHPLESFQGRWD